MGKQMKGMLGEKLGMTQVFDENNRIVPVTVVAAGPCVVTQVRSADVDGYAAVQIGYGAVDPRQVNKPESGHFAKAGVTPRRLPVELRTDDATEYTLGQEITAELFEAGQRVDVERHQQGQGLRRRHEAPRLPRRGRRPRRPPQPPQARLHRRLRHPRPGLQGHADGRPDGWRPHHDPGPDRARRRRREGPAAHQGRRPRPQGRRRPRPHRGQGHRLAKGADQ